MIEVHAPHNRIEGLRDFLVHLLTITIGLLIALGLEACVGWSHHRSLRREAEANIQHELADNQKELAKVRADSGREHQNLISILQFLEARLHQEPNSTKDIKISYTVGSMGNASWTTASATGALGYMEYSEVKRYADVYNLQDEYVRLQRQALDDFLQVQSYFIYGFDPNKITAAEAEPAIEDIHHALSHLNALDQFAESLSSAYKNALPPH